MGRLAKPKCQKELEGRRVANKNEPVYQSMDCSPPDWLCPAAVAEWQRLSPQLQANKLLTDADITIFALYCQAYADVGRLTKEIRKEGEVSPDQNNQDRKNPKIMIKNNAIQTLTDAIKQLGFSPVTRSKIIVTASEGKEANPFLKFQGKYNGGPGN